MKHIYTFVILSILFTSCNKKTVLLPESNNQQITEILDVSPVYLFYDESKPDSTDFNRKNMISTTNWLVNIDKRLTLRQIMPHLQYLQKKRNKDGMHKNENAKNYFTCSNPNIQNLAFIEFTDVIYKMTSIGKDSTYLNTPKTKAEYRLNASFHARSSLSLVFNKNQNVKIGNEDIPLNQLHEKLRLYIKEYNFIGFNLKLYFDKNLTFQEYISSKSELLQLDFENVDITNNEFIYN